MGELTEASLVETIKKLNEAMAEQEKTLTVEPKYLIVHPQLFRKAMRMFPRRRYKTKKKWQV